jgi:acyl-coenzyme A synthetase/AMP-(fatty) acid ligase
MSIFDLFDTLLAGATAIIIPDVIMRLPAVYAGLLAKQRASVLFTVPFLLSQLLLRGALQNHDLSALRWMVFGGDNHSPEHIRQLMQALPHTRFSHMYGPAETNGCTYLHLQQPPSDPQLPIPIGQRCPGMLVELRAPDGQPLSPTDAADLPNRGEIWVSGATLMRGYWNRPDLTGRVLIDEADANGQPQRWCRTGDLAERLPDGQLRFLGRKDRQVKLRGFRIELEEIETLMLAHPGVEEAAAFIVGDPASGQRLTACIIAAPGQQLDTDALLGTLAKSLPRYAMPEAIETRGELPRTASGKIDRLALALEWQQLEGAKA